MRRHDHTLTQATTARVVLVVSAMSLAGCALVLGGLDEGSPHADADAGPIDDASMREAAPSCPGAVPGFKFRRPLAIDPGGASTNDYTVTVPLPTDELTKSAKVQPTGADYLFTDGDGRPLPFALDEKPGTVPTRAFVRLDLRRPAQAWLHYGNPTAALRNDPMAPYAQGLIDDPTFARRDGWTVTFRSDPADSAPARWSVAYEDEGIRLVVSRSVGTNGTGIAACQTVTFPPDSSYRIVFDTAFSREGASSADVIVSDLERHAVWGHSEVEGQTGLSARHEESVAFPGGTRVLCLSTNLSGAGQVDARFSRIRARRVASPEPVVSVLDEERSCP